MILGALLDTKQISTCKLDVKPDVHVCTILYRLLYGVEKIVADANMVKEVIDITRQMHPENPWVLDDPLFDLGRRICKAKNPNCPNCPLIDICAFHYGVHLKIKKEQRDLPKVFARNHGAK